ncbi:MAG: hypothetical protein HYY58_03035 [Candidatus Omnitrophica bacterium]|nr:hypothetical protein [Candidatus Omnitrophota bacterium]
MDTPDDAPLACSAYGNPFLFTGREYDCESGLYYYRSRYYDSRTGRFLQEDPVLPRGEFSEEDYISDEEAVEKEADVSPLLRNPQNFARYTYVNNNPTLLMDPHGESGVLARAAVRTAFKAGAAAARQIGKYVSKEFQFIATGQEPGVVFGVVHRKSKTRISLDYHEITKGRGPEWHIAVQKGNKTVHLGMSERARREAIEAARELIQKVGDACRLGK